MNLKRGMALLFGSAAVAAGALLPGAPAAAASAATYPGSCYIWDNEANMPGACDDQTTSFSEAGVRIWNDPYQPTAVLGTGGSGQLFNTLNFVSDGAAWSCESGVTTQYWYRGVYTSQGVVGWVPDCYLNGRPA